MVVTDVLNIEQYRHIIDTVPNVVALFYINEYKNLRVLELLNNLAKKKKYINITFIAVDFIVLNDIVSMYHIYRVPYLIYFKNKKIVNKIAPEQINYQNPSLIQEYLDLL
jgi:hypothetical protein